jgi:hypothetical protein
MQEQQAIKLKPNRRSEYPIVRFWYTKQAGFSVEEIIDREPSFIEWAISTFQNVTPQQASYFKKKTGKLIPDECIQDVKPYEHLSSDPDSLYEELCESGKTLDETLHKYRGVQLNLF